jgi:hypothetical protein
VPTMSKIATLVTSSVQPGKRDEQALAGVDR